VALLSSTLALSALAQQAPTREQEQIRRLRMQLQQLQQELATARQGEAAARSAASIDLDAARAEAQRAQRTAVGSSRRLAELEAEQTLAREAASASRTQLEQRTGEREQARQALAEAREQLARRDQRLAAGERSADALLTRYLTQNQALDLCARSNASLQVLSMEVLDRWQRADWGDLLAAKEPFVQSRRVEIENLVQGYEDRIDRARLPARP